MGKADTEENRASNEHIGQLKYRGGDREKLSCGERSLKDSEVRKLQISRGPTGSGLRECKEERSYRRSSSLALQGRGVMQNNNKQRGRKDGK